MCCLGLQPVWNQAVTELVHNDRRWHFDTVLIDGEEFKSLVYDPRKSTAHGTPLVSTAAGDTPRYLGNLSPMRRAAMMDAGSTDSWDMDEGSDDGEDKGVRNADGDESHATESSARTSASNNRAQSTVSTLRTPTNLIQIH